MRVIKLYRQKQHGLLQYLNHLIFMSVCAGVVIRGNQNAAVGGMGQTGLTALARLHFLSVCVVRVCGIKVSGIQGFLSR